MTCDECQILREHYPRDPEVRLGRVRLFSPACLHCGARYIQWIQRMSGRPAEARRQACRAVVKRWVAHGHDEQALRDMAKATAFAVAPAKPKIKERPTR